MRRFALFATVTLLAGCGDATGPNVLDLRVASVAVTPDTISLLPGSQAQLRARPLSARGAPALGRTVTWSTADATVATISATGVLTAHSPGTAHIIATSDSVEGRAVVIVDPRRVASVAIEPLTMDLLPEQTILLRAVVRDSAGNVIRHRMVSWHSSNDAMVSVNDTGYVRAVGANGAASVTATVDGIAATARIAVLPSPCSVSQAIAVGQSVNASLSAAVCTMSSGRYALRYRLDLAAATSLRIDMRSSTFDALLYLTDLNGRTIEADDDGGAGTDASIAGRVPAGSYIIWATTAEARTAGSFTLNVAIDAAQPCARTRDAFIGTTVDAYLSPLDCRTSDGPFADRYRIDLSNTSTLRVDMTSNALDAFLLITDLSGNIILRDDDSAGGSNAQIAATLGAGSYIIWASSWDDGDTGAYRLDIDTDHPANCRSVRPVALGWAASGTLSSASCLMPSGHYAERWRLDLDFSRTVRISMSSFWVDSYIIVTDLDGRIIAEDDEGGGRGDAYLLLGLPPGSYIIWATSYARYEVGGYQLWVR